MHCAARLAAQQTGLPDDFIAGLDRAAAPAAPTGDGHSVAPAAPAPDAAPGPDDAFVVTLSYPHTIPILRKCSVEATRKKVCVGFYFVGMRGKGGGWGKG